MLHQAVKHPIIISISLTIFSQGNVCAKFSVTVGLILKILHGASVMVEDHYHQRYAVVTSERKSEIKLKQN